MPIVPVVRNVKKLEFASFLFFACVCVCYPLIAKGQHAHEKSDLISQNNSQAAALERQSLNEKHSDAPAYIDADEMFQNTNEGLILAKGNVIYKRGALTVRADEMSYKNQDVVSASGNVVASLPSKGLVYAEKFVFSQTQKKGFIQTAYWELLGGQTATAERIDIVDGQYILRDATFTSCGVCADDQKAPSFDPAKSGSGESERLGFETSRPTANEEGYSPIWEFRAPKIEQGQDRLRYYWPYFLIKGIPVAVSPYFTHVSGSIRRAPGLLMPTIGSSTLLGTYINLYAYTPVSEHSDLTIVATPASDDTSRIGLEYRQAIENGDFSLGGSLAPKFQKNLQSQGVVGDTDFNESWHVQLAARKRLSSSYVIGGNGLRVSDENYAYAYNIGGALLTSRAYIEYLEKRDYGFVETLLFQDFRDVGANEKAPFVFPRMTSEFYGKTGDTFGGTHYMTFDLLALHRRSERDTYRINWQGGWLRNLGNPFGIYLDGHAWVRLDRYLTDYKDSTSQEAIDNNFGTVHEGRVQTAGALNAAYPIYLSAIDLNAATVKQVLTPKVKLRLSNNIKRTSNIPNEDSTIVELNDQTVVQDNWYPGLDRIDDINRIAGSVTHSLYSGASFNLTSTLAKAWTLDTYNHEELELTGLVADSDTYRTQTPLYFGSHLSLPFGIEVDYRTALTDRDQHSWFQDIGVLQKQKVYSWEMLMSEASQGQGKDTLGEMQATVSTKFIKDFDVSGSFRRRLYGDEERLRKLQGKINYSHECYEIGVSVTADWSDELNGYDKAWLFTVSLRNLN